MEYLIDIIGRWPGKILGLLYLYYLAHITAVMVAEYGGFITDAFMPETPTIVFFTVGLAIAAFTVKQGLEVMGDVISPILGKSMGYITGIMGPRALLKVDITLEEKAMQDYKNLIFQMGDGQMHLFDVLWDNLIDEDLHTAWFANKLKELEQG